MRLDARLRRLEGNRTGCLLCALTRPKDETRTPCTHPSLGLVEILKGLRDAAEKPNRRT